MTLARELYLEKLLLKDNKLKRYIMWVVSCMCCVCIGIKMYYVSTICCYVSFSSHLIQYYYILNSCVYNHNGKTHKGGKCTCEKSLFITNLQALHLFLCILFDPAYI